jgi:hypothetical protein
MATALVSQLEQPGSYEGLSFDERLQLLADSEHQDREQRKQNRLTNAPRFKLTANARDIDYQQSRGLNHSAMASLL